MNYILIMTEGTDEKAFIDVLLDKRILKFSRSDLLAEQVFHLRQIDAEVMGFIQLLPYNDNVTIYRVGDKLNEKLKVPSKILPKKIKEIINISTTPEFEILFLLHENLYDEYLKYKSYMKPSSFYKMKNKNYKKQSQYVYDFFNNMPSNEIISLIKLYVKKHGKTHSDNHKSLKELIK